MSTLAKTLLTPEQYLEIERKAEFKSEYYQGEMLAMAGARDPHNLIAGNVFAELHQQLRRRTCYVYGSDMRVHVPSTGLCTYPDVHAVRGERQFLDEERDTLLNPALIVEVLSQSTEAYDRGLKFAQYRTIKSLREYLMISPYRLSAELYSRQADDRWTLTAANRMEDTIKLESIDCRLALADVYEKVELPPNPPLRTA